MNKNFSFRFHNVRCARALFQSTVVVDLLVVQVFEGEPVTEGQPQHLGL